MGQKSRPAEEKIWEAELAKAQACASPAELQEIMAMCLWKVQQQQLLLKSAILAYYNGGQVPRPSIDDPFPKAETAVADRKSDWRPGPDGEYVESEVAVLARELEQALKLGDVHVHGLSSARLLTERLAKEAESTPADQVP
ncbi:hypothetical protein ACIBI8_37150 [Streptomyces sp. NPDC050529]|uniref:hypothetical protein n=1 Tax=Streptomyces sp. NPDC050529 TaxID=3365624 RepID=UPI00378D98D1